MGRSNRELIQKFANGDDEAFAALYHRNKHQIYRYCCRLMWDAEGAKDIVQRVFVKLYEGRERASEIENLSAWLYTVARHDCQHQMERRGMTVSPDESQAMQDQESTQVWQQSTNGHELAKTVRTAIGRLAFDDQEVLTLREYEGKSYREIADCLAIPESTVRFRLHTARRRLYEILKPIFRTEAHT